MSSPDRSSTRPLPPFEELIELHGEALLRFCRLRAGPEHAEDAFQETMLAALRGYEQVQEPDAILGWLFAIAARKTIDLARRRTRQPLPVENPDVLVSESRWMGVAAGPEALIATSSGELPEQDLWELVRRLPAKQRQAVTLRYLGDLTNQEIAAVTQSSVEAVRRSVFEGLEKLRQHEDA